MPRRRRKKPYRRPWFGGGRRAKPPAGPPVLACPRCGFRAEAPVVDATARVPCPADGCGAWLARPGR